MKSQAPARFWKSYASDKAQARGVMAEKLEQTSHAVGWRRRCGKNAAMTLEEILQDVHGLDARLRELEQKYGMLSEDLYALCRLGELEQSRDLIRWVGYYELRQERQLSRPVTEWCQ